jgi:hypothetical protein
VYDDIDRLAAAGLIDAAIQGVRPLSRSEIVRLLKVARVNALAGSANHAWANAVVAADLARYEPAAQPWDALRIEATGLSSPSREIEADGSGGVAAAINPLAAYRGGREPNNSGAGAAVESFHSAGVGWLSVSLNPRLSLVHRSANNMSATIRIQTASVSAAVHNVVVEAGRDYAVFGVSPTGGLLLSSNAPPLDLVRISNDSVTVLPGVLHVLGPVRATLLVADLGAAQQHPHEKLIAYHVAIAPHPQLELGLQLIDLMGGTDRPSTSFTAKLVDLFPFVDPILRRRSTFPDSLSNKMAGGDVRWRLPALAGLELYGEFGLDDFDGRRLRSSFLEDGGYIAGALLSCIGSCGDRSLRVEYRQTGIRFYTHTDYGVALNGNLLGDALGPRGLGAYTTYDASIGLPGRLAISASFEVRSGNTYGAIATDVDTRDFHFIQLTHRPGEKRTRLTASWDTPLAGSRMELSVMTGAEFVTNDAFVSGRSRTNGFGAVRLELRP